MVQTKMVNIDKDTVRQILHDQLHMTKICTKMVPKNNRPAQNILSIKQFLAKNLTPVLQHLYIFSKYRFMQFWLFSKF